MKTKTITFDDLVDYGAQQALLMINYYSSDPDDDNSESKEAGMKSRAAVQIIADFYFGGDREDANNVVQNRRCDLQDWRDSLFYEGKPTREKNASIRDDAFSHCPAYKAAMNADGQEAHVKAQTPADDQENEIDDGGYYGLPY